MDSISTRTRAAIARNGNMTRPAALLPTPQWLLWTVINMAITCSTKNAGKRPQIRVGIDKGKKILFPLPLMNVLNMLY